MKFRAERATFRSSPSRKKKYSSPFFDKCIQTVLGGDITDPFNSSFYGLTNHLFFFHKSIKVGDDDTCVPHEAEKGDAIMFFLKLFR